MPALQLFVLSSRWLILSGCLIGIVVLCAAAASRRQEGTGGAAVRIAVTLLGPSTLLAFAGVFWWPVALTLSVVGAAWQGWGALSELAGRAQQTWSMLSLVSKVAVCTLAVAIAFRLGAAISMPPLDGDSLLYHLPMTAGFVQDHSMWVTRVRFLYPGAYELGEALVAATTGTVNGIAAFQALQLLLLMLAAHAWARKAGASVDASVASAVVAGALPIVIDQMGTSQNDLFELTMLVLACSLWSRAPRLAALAIGLAVAGKLTSLLLVPAVAIVMLASEGWTFSALDVLLSLGVAAPWYVRTWVLSGSPIYAVTSRGWGSTIAAHLVTILPLVLNAVKGYGGLAALAGIPALIYILATAQKRPRFARMLAWLCLLVFVAWIVMPNTTESVPGTLDQIRSGWSIRYAILLPFILATSLTVALDGITLLPLSALIALAASANAVVRSANMTASNGGLAFFFALPLLLCFVCVFQSMRAFWFSKKRFVGFSGLALATAVLAITGVTGAQHMAKLWNPVYLQWTTTIPPNDVHFDPELRSASRIAVLGMRPFPLVGPNFQRRTYLNVFMKSPAKWLADLRRSGVTVFVAADASASVDQPGFMKPLPLELAIARQPGVCLVSTGVTARVYRLNSASCSQFPKR